MLIFHCLLMIIHRIHLRSKVVLDSTSGKQILTDMPTSGKPILKDIAISGKQILTDIASPLEMCVQ